MGLLIDYLMEQINCESKSEPGYRHKKLSVSAKKHYASAALARKCSGAIKHVAKIRALVRR